MSNKSFQELNLNNKFLFPAALEDPITCRLFGQKLYQYTFSMQCEERDIPLNDGVKRIFLSTRGENADEVPRILIDFLGYLNDSTDYYVKESSNEKLDEIHKRVTELKKNRDVEARYMHYLYVDKLIEEKENALKEAENAAREAENAIKEMVYELIESLGIIPKTVRDRIEGEKDIKILKLMHRTAMKSDSVEQFVEQIANL